MRCLLSSSKLLIQLRQTPFKLCLARSHTSCALFCNSEVCLCIRKLSVGPTLSANGILMLVLQLFELRSKRLHTGLSLFSCVLVLINVGTSLLSALFSLLSRSADLLQLCLRRGNLSLKTAPLSSNRGKLTVESSNLALGLRAFLAN